ncbi:hypothetical protein [Teredinibacter turnerae]|uniref:hypothetical protein n=1 Tax=Teredinibacter turnerae TaxID=2426 RepID=UPI00041D23F5|nr:hypothetical protein [Teredinibacter turnerae]
MSVFSKIRAVFNDRKGALLEVNNPQSLPPADIHQAFYGYLFPRSAEAPLSVPQKLVIEHLKKQPAQTGISRQSSSTPSRCYSQVAA